MEYQFTKRIKKPSDSQLSLILLPVPRDSFMTDTQKKKDLHKILMQDKPQSSSASMVSTKMPFTALSSEEHWNVPQTPSHARRASSALLTAANLSASAFARPANSMPPLNNLISSPATTTETSSSATSSGSLLQSTRASSETSNSNSSSWVKLENKKEKKPTVFKQLCTRASESTKAFTKRFSRNPGSYSLWSGASKHTSLKPPLSLSVPSANSSTAEGSASSFDDLSFFPAPGLKRLQSSSETQVLPSFDVPVGLRSSRSVSSTKSSMKSNIRGRNAPFPISPASQLTTTSAPRGNAHSKVPPIPTSAFNSSGVAPEPLQRSGYQTPGEVIRPTATNRGETELSSYQQRSQRSEDTNIVSVGQASSPNSSPSPSHSSLNHNGMRRTRTAMIVDRKVYVATPPAVPSKDTYQESSSTITKDVTRAIPRSGSILSNGDLPPHMDKPRKLPAPPAVSTSATVGTGSKPGNILPAAPSPARLPPPSALRRPSVSGQNLPPYREEEIRPSDVSNENILRQPSIPRTPRSPRSPFLRSKFTASHEVVSLRNQPSMQRILRSSSSSSLKPEFTVPPPPPALGVAVHDKESRGRSHMRSATIPTSPVENLLLPGDSQKTTRQPLPSDITKRLRSRGRSSSRSDDRQPSTTVTSSIVPPPLPSDNHKKKPFQLEPIPPSLNYSFLDSSIPSSAPSSGSTLSTVSSFQTPPSPTVSQLLKTRAAGHQRASSLKSPSMPDLRSATPSKSSPHRSHTPQPVQRQASSHINLPISSPLPISRRASDASRKLDSPPSTTALFHSKPSPDRFKEHSYPQLKAAISAFRGRSKKEISENRDWDFLDRPPRPTRNTVYIRD